MLGSNGLATFQQVYEMADVNHNVAAYLATKSEVRLLSIRSSGIRISV